MFQPGGNHFLIRLPFVEGGNFIFLFQENADSPSNPADSLERRREDMVRLQGLNERWK